MKKEKTLKYKEVNPHTSQFLLYAVLE